jgi:hypothetical protein
MVETEGTDWNSLYWKTVEDFYKRLLEEAKLKKKSKWLG